MLKVSIPDDFSGDHIAIFRLWPEYKWKHYDDEYDVEIEIKAGNFGGRFKAQLFLGEINEFRIGLKDLYNNLSTTLNFQSIEVIYEHQLKLRI
ncbi:hypothetical protein B1R32_11654 [Abditibacterium utsteinense]|uniref:Uncharacterized protein n=1 Tax=Abditibacterium utsteinense TaxID=1960156 RepID=A0A2S8SQK0_9BACT|nr:hypothetical protein [Abditibacterium utsteinense]PQV63077.1 hypothetical protein B1R32_11654 [Abditibacterium utsteinense]